jgi:spermidine/putrescine transport system ATP-binding protein
MTTAGGHIQLVDLVKKFGDVMALRGISVDIPPGEFFSLLGPSGCGKTTTLRMIAGFERPTSGEILLDGRDMSTTPPHNRNVNTVFQSYALFPHLNVADNVAFGLRFKKTSKAATQQRVALARALVLDPSVLLLDEPLGALDAKLRKSLQIELKALQERVGITFVYVTHDQEEALTMSDRIAVMSEGRIEQVGPPKRVYEEPETVYVADFLGVSNLMDAEVVGPDGNDRCRLRLGDFDVAAESGDLTARGSARIVIRPERVLVEPQGSTGENRIPGMIERVVYVGPSIQLLMRLANGQQLQSTFPNRGEALGWSQGTPVVVHVPPQALRVLEDTGDGPGDEDLSAPPGPSSRETTTPAPTSTKAS